MLLLLTDQRPQWQQQRGLERGPADLHQRLTCCQQRCHTRPNDAQQRAQIRIRRIRARQPDDLRRRPVARHQINEVAVFTQDDDTSSTRTLKNDGILRLAEPQIADRHRVDAQRLAHPPSQRRRDLRIDPNDRHGLRGEHRMIQPPTRKAEARRNVFALEIRQLNDDVVDRESRGEQVQDVAHADAHPAHARASAALIRIDGDAVHQLYGVAHGTYSG